MCRVSVDAIGDDFWQYQVDAVAEQGKKNEQRDHAAVGSEQAEEPGSLFPALSGDADFFSINRFFSPANWLIREILIKEHKVKPIQNSLKEKVM